MLFVKFDPKTKQTLRMEGENKTLCNVICSAASITSDVVIFMHAFSFQTSRTCPGYTEVENALVSHVWNGARSVLLLLEFFDSSISKERHFLIYSVCTNHGQTLDSK